MQEIGCAILGFTVFVLVVASASLRYDYMCVPIFWQNRRHIWSLFLMLLFFLMLASAVRRKNEALCIQASEQSSLIA